MTQKLLAAAALGLQKAFDGAYPVHVQDVAQGLGAPAFLLEVAELEKRQYLGGRCGLLWTLDVRFYPADAGDNTKMLGVAGLLLEALTFITDPDGRMYYGREIRSQIRSGVLHTSVTYGAIVTNAEAAEAMEQLDGTVNAGETLTAEE